MVPIFTTLLAFSSLGLSNLADGCTDILPSWTIKDLQASFVDEKATANWTVTNVLTGKSDTLSCVLYAMSHCRIEGLPSDPNFHMYLQTGLDVAWITINETLTCDNATAPPYLIGNARLPMECPENNQSGSVTCFLDTVTIPAGIPEIPAVQVGSGADYSS